MNPLLDRQTNGETKVTMSLSASPPPTQHHSAATTAAAAAASGYQLNISPPPSLPSHTIPQSHLTSLLTLIPPPSHHLDRLSTLHSPVTALRFSPPRPSSHHRNDTPAHPPHNDNNTNTNTASLRPRTHHHNTSIIEQQQAPTDTPSQSAPFGPVNLTGPFPVKSSLAELARSPDGLRRSGPTHPPHETPTLPMPTLPVPATTTTMTQRPQTLTLSSTMASFRWQAKRAHNNPHGVVVAHPAAAATATAPSTAVAAAAASASLVVSHSHSTRHSTPAWQQQQQGSDRQSATHPSRRLLLQRGVGTRSLDVGMGMGTELEHRCEQQGGGESSHRYEEEDDVRQMTYPQHTSHPYTVTYPILHTSNTSSNHPLTTMTCMVSMHHQCRGSMCEQPRRLNPSWRKRARKKGSLRTADKG